MSDAVPISVIETRKSGPPFDKLACSERLFTRVTIELAGFGRVQDASNYTLTINWPEKRLN